MSLSFHINIYFLAKNVVIISTTDFRKKKLNKDVNLKQNDFSNHVTSEMWGFVISFQDSGFAV